MCCDRHLEIPGVSNTTTVLQLQKSVILWTFFHIDCFSHSLYLSRAREIFHVSRVS